MSSSRLTGVSDMKTKGKHAHSSRHCVFIKQSFE